MGGGMTPFLVLAVTAPVVCAGAFLLVFRGVSRAREIDRRVRRGTGDPGELDAYDLAWPAGGRDRVVDTAIAALVHRKQLRVTRGGDLCAVAGDGRPEEPVERAVLGTVEAHGGARRARDVRRDVGGGPEVEAVRLRLEQRGLCLSEDDRASVERRTRSLANRVLVVLGAALAHESGLIVWALPAGLSVAEWIVPVAATAGMFAVAIWGGWQASDLNRGLATGRTDAGERRLAAVRTPMSGLLAYESAVALRGTAAIDDPGLTHALTGDFGGGDFDITGVSCGIGCAGGGGG